MKKQESKRPMTTEMFQMANAKLTDYLQSQNFGSLEEINEFLQKNVNGKRIDQVVPLKKGRKSNIEKSEDLMYEAYDSSPKKGLQLVKEALKLNPDNVRAMTYLADHSDKLEESYELYRQAVQIGAKQLGENYFIENKGHFWGMHETRPYMAAKLGYADCLYAIDKTEESIREYSEMLELNPGDNQGVRYILASVLLKCKKYNSYFELYQKFEDEESTFWNFNYALFLFATEGSTKKANHALSQANKQNKHVIQFMTGQKKFKTEPTGYYNPGAENEATVYMMENFKSWIDCSGSFEWVMEYFEKNKWRK